MADVQDDEQWLYGDDDGATGDKADDKPENQEKGTDNLVPEAEKTDGESEPPPPAPEATTEGQTTTEQNGEAEKTDDKDGDSSDDDDLTVTIGELKKAAEVMTPAQQQHQARFQPKAAPTAGLKDDDFNTAGKVNGVPVSDLSLNESDDKPWRKPGADLSDYFNYGFNEETWFKYCYRQKRMRVHESGSGLTSLGINMSKPFGNTGGNQSESGSNIVVAGRSSRSNNVQQSQKRVDSKPLAPQGNNNTIQVMTADRREYSSKIMNQPPPYMTGPPPPSFGPGYDDMDFGGNAYMAHPDNGYGYPPAAGPNFYNTPPPPTTNNYGNEWSNPPPPILNPVGPPTTESSRHRWGGDAPPTPALRKSNTPPYRDRDSDEDRRRSRRHRRSSRSPSRSRHRSRSRSRSPSHKHKRKKSKRDRED